MSRDLLAEFPVCVRFPLSGKYVLLEWWTEWEQKHVSLGRNLNQLVGIWKTILASERFGSGAKPTGFYNAEIVSPPLAIREQYALSALRAEQLDFKHWVRSSLREFNYTGYLCAEQLPPGVSRCPNAANKDFDYHECFQCFGGYAVAGHTLETFYEAKRELWASLGGKPPTPAGYRPTPAPEALSGAPLFAVVHAPGHHCAGTYVQKIEKYLSDSPLFVFTGAEGPLPRELTAPHQELLERDKETERARRAEHQLRGEQEKQAHLVKIRMTLSKLFPGQ